MKELKYTFYDLLVGIVCFSILLCVTGPFFSGNVIRFIAGVLYGGMVAAILAYHMFQGIDKTMDFDPVGAEKYARKMAGIRMLIMVAAAFLAVFLSSVFSMIGVLLGMLSLKIAGYLQPIIRRYITIKIYNKGR
ncbi:MAG: hypothetical protein PWP24_1585 [Clostridiales bacterium]|nr:hypothetical protein [Clostridiales bacterium]